MTNVTHSKVKDTDVTLVFNEAEWAKIYTQLAQRYATEPSVLLIRDKMKRVLGFTVRRHRFWDKDEYEWSDHIVLDFYNPEAKTLFLLTYR